ncbi:hypothetical protein N7492_003728 [Penicillium capsulatum]|uniref:Amidohydrolase-related domain-containing protein n=1 Tax=Penicillium capsulatum TaxID=69766 RepID=A0A9W9LWH5_9EURO|nr:hypothetical protein N7492_003728 [Penicillium capsulatum]KAJ6121690.1 hypothetical protein N7512_004155 [Penicillium capsulatum]
MPASIPIVDSHIHLFAASHLPSLAWYGPDGPLGSQHSVDEYSHATSSVSNDTTTSKDVYLRGFIFLETDRLSSVSTEGSESFPGWKHALDEVAYLARIARGEPFQGEGHSSSDKDLCLGIVAWAPVPGGLEALSAYMALVKERTKSPEVWRKVRGVRYLFQDKPAGTMTAPDTVQGLRWLGQQGLTFDLGVDARQRGLDQLREAVTMMEQVYSGAKEDESVTIVINHLCKPNLRLPPDTIATHSDFLEWKDLITQMAQISDRTYMKLSGAFSELPSLSATTDLDLPGLVDYLQPWTDVIFNSFGTERIMFGSDWPVCNIGGGGNDVSWNRWQRVVEGILDRRGLTEEQKRGIWGQVALKAYGADI